MPANWRWSGGTLPIVSAPADGVRAIVAMAREATAARGVARGRDIIAIAAGMPFGVAGSTNLLRIEQMPADAGPLISARATILEAEGA